MTKYWRICSRLSSSILQDVSIVIAFPQECPSGLNSKPRFWTNLLKVLNRYLSCSIAKVRLVVGEVKVGISGKAHWG
jgi:hypothetical protein